MRILSLGAGVQSSTLALMIAKGEVPMVDCAIFADTQSESRATYEWLNWIEKQLPFPLYRVTHGNLEADILADAREEIRYMLPTYTNGGGMGKRQCTAHYKIKPLRRKVRELGATAKNPATILIGISLDEAWRMKPSDRKYQVHTWPLVDMLMTRYHCIEWMRARFGKTPPKSACIFCPYGDNKRLGNLPWNEYNRVVRLDAFIRHRAGTPGTVQYLRRELMPVPEIDLSASTQIDMFINECEGICGV